MPHLRMLLALTAVICATVAMALLPARVSATNIPSHTAITVRVLAHRDECFYEDVPSADMKVYLHFMVASGGSLDLDVAVHGPEGTLIWSTERETEGRILFRAKMAGAHKFCFSNRMSTLTSKAVSFNIIVGDPSEKVLGHTADSVERSVTKVVEGLNEIKNEQNYLRTRERIHRETTESTNTRVFLWSMAEIGLIVGMGVAQVTYLKRLFGRRRFV